MSSAKNVSRRNFLRQSSIGLGLGMTAGTFPSCNTINNTEKKIPGELRIATIDLRGLWPDNTMESRIRKVLARMEEVAGMQPDIICLPELFNTIWVAETKPLQELAEDEKKPGPVTTLMADFAKNHDCYVICPIYTHNNGNFYNSSILIDRRGNIAGLYNKMHPVKSEILNNEIGRITPGALSQPVIETEFGKAGMVICYDANWMDIWDNWKKQNADIIFFSSAFPGGRILNYYAYRNNCYIVSSTGSDARIIDISGNDLASSSTFVRYAWATVNTNKVRLSSWPARDRLADIFRKYTDRLKITEWPETDTITIESLDPGLKVDDVLEEFNLQTGDKILQETEAFLEKYR